MGLTNEELLVHCSLRHGLKPQNAVLIKEDYQFHELRKLHDNIHADAIPGQTTVTDHFHAEEDVKLGEQVIAEAGEVIDKCEGPHRPVQHRDGKPPWCPKCGLTAQFEIPVTKIGKRQ